MTKRSFKVVVMLFLVGLGDKLLSEVIKQRVEQMTWL